VLFCCKLCFSVVNCVGLVVNCIVLVVNCFVLLLIVLVVLLILLLIVLVLLLIVYCTTATECQPNCTQQIYQISISK